MNAPSRLYVAFVAVAVVLGAACVPNCPAGMVPSDGACTTPEILKEKARMDGFSTCLGARGDAELTNDKSKNFKTDVQLEKQGVNLLVDWKDKLEKKYTPVPNACTERRIIELCYAVSTNVPAKDVDCNSVGASTASGTSSTTPAPTATTASTTTSTPKAP